jgi:uncharacterized membrane protein
MGNTGRAAAARAGEDSKLIFGITMNTTMNNIKRIAINTGGGDAPVSSISTYVMGRRET